MSSYKNANLHNFKNNAILFFCPKAWFQQYVKYNTCHFSFCVLHKLCVHVVFLFIVNQLWKDFTPWIKKFFLTLFGFKWIESAFNFDHLIHLVNLGLLCLVHFRQFLRLVIETKTKSYSKLLLSLKGFGFLFQRNSTFICTLKKDDSEPWKRAAAILVFW